MAEHRWYRLEPLDTSGVFLGLGVVQSALLGGGIVLGVLAATAGLPLPLMVTPVLTAAAASFGRAGGHPVWEWLPLSFSWVRCVLGRGRRWAPPLPLWPTDADRPPPLPPCLAGLDIRPVSWPDGAEAGVVVDVQRGTLAAIVRVEGAPFSLEPRLEQERLVGGWGELLAQFATEQSRVTHISWSDLTRPCTMADHRRFLAQTGEQAMPDRAASYDEVVDVAGEVGVDRCVMVTVTVSGSARRRSGTAGVDGVALPEDSLVSAVEGMLRALRSAGLGAGEPLDPRGICRLLRERVDPLGGRAGGGSHQTRLADRLGLVRSASAGPLVVDTSWRHVRTDAAFHRTYWVSAWPQLPVPPSWLEPFLGGAAGVTRSMTVTFMPIPGHQSRRRIERDLVKLQSDADSKDEKGRRVDARHRRATEALLEREQELVSGFAEMAYVGLVTVSALDRDQLEEHAEIVEQRAREVGMDLRVLDGRQDLAWAAALPLGLAPRALLGS